MVEEDQEAEVEEDGEVTREEAVDGVDPVGAAAVEAVVDAVETTQLLMLSTFSLASATCCKLCLN